MTHNVDENASAARPAPQAHAAPPTDPAPQAHAAPPTDPAPRGPASPALVHDMPLHPLLSRQSHPPLLETHASKVIHADMATVFAHFWGSQPELRLELHKDHVKSYHIQRETEDTLEYEYVFEAYGARNWGRAVEVASRPDRIDVEVTDGPLLGQTVTMLFEPVEGGTRATQVNRVWPGRSDLMVRLMGNTLRSRLTALAGVHLEQHRAAIEGGERFQDRFSREHQERLAQERRGTLADLLLTTRAITLPIILLPLIAAAVLAAGQGTFSWLVLALTLVGGGAAQLGANLLNDLWDFRGGADQATRTVPGAIETGSGVFVEGRWSLRKGWRGTGALYAVALACGVALAWLATPWVLAFAAAGAAIAYVYIGPPFPLAYRGRGLGELAIFAAFGLLPVLGGVVAHGGTITPTVWWVGALFGLVSSIVLFHHHFLHWMADKVAGKGSPVALLGPRRGAVAGIVLVAATALAIAAAAFAGPIPPAVAAAAPLPLLVLPAALRVARGDDSPPARTKLATAGFFAAVLTGIALAVTLGVG